MAEEGMNCSNCNRFVPGHLTQIHNCEFEQAVEDNWREIEDEQRFLESLDDLRPPQSEDVHHYRCPRCLEFVFVDVDKHFQICKRCPTCKSFKSQPQHRSVCTGPPKLEQYVCPICLCQVARVNRHIEGVHGVDVLTNLKLRRKDFVSTELHSELDDLVIRATPRKVKRERFPVAPVDGEDEVEVDAAEPPAAGADQPEVAGPEHDALGEGVGAASGEPLLQNEDENENDVVMDEGHGIAVEVSSDDDPVRPEDFYVSNFDEGPAENDILEEEEIPSHLDTAMECLNTMDRAFADLHSLVDEALEHIEAHDVKISSVLEGLKYLSEDEQLTELRRSNEPPFTLPDGYVPEKAKGLIFTEVDFKTIYDCPSALKKIVISGLEQEPCAFMDLSNAWYSVKKRFEPYVFNYYYIRMFTKPEMTNIQKFYKVLTLLELTRIYFKNPNANLRDYLD